MSPWKRKNKKVGVFDVCNGAEYFLEVFLEICAGETMGILSFQDYAKKHFGRALNGEFFEEREESTVFFVFSWGVAK